jgi:hypothetical protein
MRVVITDTCVHCDFLALGEQAIVPPPADADPRRSAGVCREAAETFASRRFEYPGRLYLDLAIQTVHGQRARGTSKNTLNFRLIEADHHSRDSHATFIKTMLRQALMEHYRQHQWLASEPIRMVARHFWSAHE